MAMVLIGMVSLYSCQWETAAAEKTGTNSDTTTVVASELVLVYGIDISKYQGNEVDFINKKENRLSFVICKATEGVTYTDPDFQHNWKMIAQKGLIRGAYHFYRCDDQPEAQSKNYLDKISNLQETDLPPIIDFEEGGIDKTQSVEQIQMTLITFLKEIENKTGRTPIIYTNINVGNNYLDKPEFANYPLWIANYTKEDQPRIPNAWKNRGWVLWQKSDNYKLDNQLNDFDIFNGSLQQLKEFIQTN